MIQALAFEAGGLLVASPLFAHFTGAQAGDALGRDALVADIGLTLAYALYGYFFHWGFDLLRPVRTVTRSTR